MMTQITAFAAFTGWNDASESASGALRAIREQFSWQEVARIHADNYVDLQISRPQIFTDAAGKRQVTWPDTVIYRVDPGNAGQPFYTLEGPEPSLRWRKYCRKLCDLLSKQGVTRLVTFGSLLADCPHSRPLPVNRSSETAAHIARPNSYQGPIGVPTILLRLAAERDYEAVSLWARVPHYLSQEQCPPAALALAEQAQSFLSVPLDLEPLRLSTAQWREKIASEMAQNESLAAYVSQLEEDYDANHPLQQASGAEIVREVERFLREQS
ncbi:PAC2 family protein [Dermabacteraceae bacterium P13138]